MLTDYDYTYKKMIAQKGLSLVRYKSGCIQTWDIGSIGRFSTKKNDIKDLNVIATNQVSSRKKSRKMKVVFELVKAEWWKLK